jgi:hypothetical protein
MLDLFYFLNEFKNLMIRSVAVDRIFMKIFQSNLKKNILDASKRIPLYLMHKLIIIKVER